MVGQYRGRQAGTRRLPGYLEDKTVPQGRCAACHLRSSIS